MPPKCPGLARRPVHGARFPDPLDWAVPAQTCCRSRWASFLGFPQLPAHTPQGSAPASSTSLAPTTFPKGAVPPHPSLAPGARVLLGQSRLSRSDSHRTDGSAWSWLRLSCALAQ